MYVVISFCVKAWFMLLWMSEKKNSVKVKTHIIAEGNTHNIFHFENINFKYVIRTPYSTLKI